MIGGVGFAGGLDSNMVNSARKTDFIAREQ